MNNIINENFVIRDIRFVLIFCWFKLGLMVCFFIKYMGVVNVLVFNSKDSFFVFVGLFNLVIWKFEFSEF